MDQPVELSDAEVMQPSPPAASPRELTDAEVMGAPAPSGLAPVAAGQLVKDEFDALAGNVERTLSATSPELLSDIVKIPPSQRYKMRAAEQFKAGGLLNDLYAIGNGVAAMVAGIPEALWDLAKLPGDVATGKQAVDESVIPRTAFAALMVEGTRIGPALARPGVEPALPRIEVHPALDQAEMLTQAHDLGVVGPPKPDISGLAPKEAAARAIPAARADEIMRGSEPAENPWQQRFEHFVDRLDTPDAVKQLIRDAAKENGDFLPARQGDIPLSQVEAIREAAGVEPGVIDQRGIGRLLKNDAEVRVAMRTMLQVTDNLTEAARSVRADASPENLIAMQRAIMQRDLAVEQIVGLRAEWGRTGKVFQEFMENVKSQEQLGEFLKDKGRTPDDLRNIADTITGLNSPDQVARYMNDLRRPSVWDKYLFYWTNALISGPITHAKYIGANAAFAGYDAGMVTPVAGAIGAARRAVTGTNEGVFAGEAAARMWGLLAGTPDALKAAVRAARENIQVPLPGEVAKNINPVINQRPNPIGGIAGAVLGIPSRGASGIHSFFNFLGYRAEVEAQAYRGAAKEGLSPRDDAFWQRYSQLAANPTDAAMERAIENGYRLTFIEEQGTLGKALSGFVNTRLPLPGGGEWQPLKIVFPFLHIPGNLLRAGLRQTPFGPLIDGELRADLLGKNGAAAQDTAMARFVVGGLVSAMVANWALNDRVTGYGPTDPGERAIWLRSHQPYSVKIGPWWVSYSKFGPIGDLVGLVANVAEVAPKVAEEKYNEAAAMILKASTKLLQEEVGMEGLANMIEAMDDPEHKGARLLGSQIASNIPFSSALRQMASFNDPYMREAKTVVDELRYATPWTRQDLLPKRDPITGAALDNPAYHSILRQRAVSVDPLDAELARLQIKPSAPLDRIGNVKLTPELYDRYQALAGAFAKSMLDPMVHAAGWGQLPDYMREEALRNTIEGARRMGAAAMQARYPALIEAGVKQQVDHITGAAHTSRPKESPLFPHSPALQGVGR